MSFEINRGHQVIVQQRDLWEYSQGLRTATTGGTIAFGALPSNNETITITSSVDENIYTFKTTLTGAANEVHIKATRNLTMQALAAAINVNAPAVLGIIDPKVGITAEVVLVGVDADTIQLFTSVPGTAGNTALAEDSALITVASLSGGVDIDGPMEVVVAGFLMPDIDIGDVNLLNVAKSQINPSTSEKQDTIITALGTLATEATLGTLATEATLGTLATEATLGTLATEATLGTLATETTLGTLATETTLGTLATEATLGTLATEATLGDISSYLYSTAASASVADLLVDTGNYSYFSSSSTAGHPASIASSTAEISSYLYSIGASKSLVDMLYDGSSYSYFDSSSSTGHLYAINMNTYSSSASASVADLIYNNLEGTQGHLYSSAGSASAADILYNNFEGTQGHLYSSAGSAGAADILNNIYGYLYSPSGSASVADLLYSTSGSLSAADLLYSVDSYLSSIYGNTGNIESYLFDGSYSYFNNASTTGHLYDISTDTGDIATDTGDIATATGLIESKILKDATYECQASTSFATHKVNAGDAFVAVHEEMLDGINEQIAVAFKTGPTRKTYLRVDACVSALGRIGLYKGTSIDVDEGTQLTPQNRNQNSATASTMLTIETAPVAGKLTSYTAAQAAGANITLTTPLISRVVGADGGPLNIQGGTYEGELWILEPSTEYAVVIETLTADDNYACINLNWFEHTDPVS